VLASQREASYQKITVVRYLQSLEVAASYGALSLSREAAGLGRK